MPNPLTLSDAADLIDLSIQDVFLKGSEDQSRYYEQYFNVETGITDYYVKDSSLSGLGTASRIVENAAVVASSPVQGYDKTYTQVRFGSLISFSKNMWFFGIKKRDLTNVTQEAINACADKREYLCADRLDNSYSSSYLVTDGAGNYVATTTGGDGQPFITNGHTREDGGSNWTNRVTDGTTVNMAFDYPGLKAAYRTAALIPNPVGKPTNIMLDTLVVSRGYAAHNRALEILGALGRNALPGSADKDGAGLPTAKNGGQTAPTFKIVALPWIQTNTAYWWMFDSSKKNSKYGLQYKEAQPITLDPQHVVYRTDEIQYKATLYFDVGFNDARNWVGSKATNAA